MKSGLFLATGLMMLLPARATETPSVADRMALINGNNAFAVDLYGQLRNQRGNLFFSPESISTALAMAFAGARGDTATQMAQTLHFTLPSGRLQPALSALLNQLNGPHPGYQLRVADALWAQEGETFLDDFLSLMRNDYSAGLNQVDFRGATKAARQTINHWVEQKTDGKIKDLLQPGALSSQTRLVLTNAIYFRGNWQTQFNKDQSKEQDFHLAQGHSVKALLMHCEGSFKYLDGGTFQALEIPYKGEELSMIVFLPKEGNRLSYFEQALTAAKMRQWLSELRPVSKVVVTLPKFKMTQQFALSDTLSVMGMPQAFEKGVADFSGMTGKRQFVISAVVHKAYIGVTEEGTEAAAATGVVVRQSLARQNVMPPVVFRADHPFLFLIRDNRSDSILFMGRVSDPTNLN